LEPPSERISAAFTAYPALSVETLTAERHREDGMQKPQESCENCEGKGWLWIYAEGGEDDPVPDHMEDCPDCLGTGKVDQ